MHTISSVCIRRLILCRSRVALRTDARNSLNVCPGQATVHSTPLRTQPNFVCFSLSLHWRTHPETRKVGGTTVHIGRHSESCSSCTTLVSSLTTLADNSKAEPGTFTAGSVLSSQAMQGEHTLHTCCLRSSSEATNAELNFVGTIPGAIPFTRIPSRPSSQAKALTAPSRAVLDIA
jgi:hypothetical protein